ncbi:anti-sigma factor [Mesorhizobium sp. BAC0120]|uniref:anti-sigma factor family protein n=1 Tax=Mesorhizobium sp. BAC0120 TaxID=3090670 RepID=UPI00298C9C47|nr:anti-sigma factor [Mesorhizobium sp. BAC0120]MDW6021212.1 anti-sigma factor [Mesorhizobium sp. BAC0120]
MSDIHLALDGELPDDDRAEFERWLESHPDMKAQSARFERDGAILAAALAPILDEPVPSRLTKLASGEVKPRRSWTISLRNAAAAAVVFVAGGIAGYFIASSGSFNEEDLADRLAENAIGAYVTFTASLPHAVDVGADDRAYLEGWLSKRTGLKIIAPDLAASGFELLGGRILPSGENIAALLVYKDKSGNQLSIYMVGEGGEKAKGTYTPEEGGPTAIYWMNKGFGCAIVGSLPRGQLAEVARNAWRQMVEAGAVG